MGDPPLLAHVPAHGHGDAATAHATMRTSCHGASGKGDGPAAAALDPKPADHTDPVHAHHGGGHD